MEIGSTNRNLRGGNRNKPVCQEVFKQCLELTPVQENILGHAELTE